MTDVVNGLEESSDELLEKDQVAELREEVLSLKDKVESQRSVQRSFGTAQDRPALSGATSAARSAFVDGICAAGWRWRPRPWWR